MTSLAQAQQLAGKRPRRSKAALPASQTPHACVVLAVDPGEACGVALYHGGQFASSRVIGGYDADEIRSCIVSSAVIAEARGERVVLVLEKPPRVLYRTADGTTVRSLSGVGSVIGCRKLWEAEWKRDGRVQRSVVSVEPSTWRAAVFGSVRGLKSEELKALALRRVTATSHPTCTSPDEAEAILIGLWATRAGQVGAVLPKNLRGRI